MYQILNIYYTKNYSHGMMLTDVVGKYFLEIYAIEFI